MLDESVVLFNVAVVRFDEVSFIVIGCAVELAFDGGIGCAFGFVVGGVDAA